jgi:hypothetical protein
VRTVSELLLGEGYTLPNPPQHGASAGLDLDRIERLGESSPRPNCAVARLPLPG